MIPSSWDLPNLLVVGAVDQAGDPTSFTSGGETVRVYASGFEVESYVPGGTRMPMSGTSMASPQVCNLAGKVFAKNPKLTPAEVVALIQKQRDPEPGAPGDQADPPAADAGGDEVGADSAGRTQESGRPTVQDAAARAALPDVEDLVAAGAP